MPPAIVRFFDRYASYFTTSDSQQIAAMYEFPATLYSATGRARVLDKPAFLRDTELVFQGYARVGMHHIRYRLVGDSPVNPVLRLVEMEWIFENAAGERLTDFRTRYLVRDYRGHLSILGVVEVDESARLSVLTEQEGAGAGAGPADEEP